MTHSVPTRRSSELRRRSASPNQPPAPRQARGQARLCRWKAALEAPSRRSAPQAKACGHPFADDASGQRARLRGRRSEEHTSELQSLMRISYAVFCLKKKKNNTNKTQNSTTE